MKRRIIPLNSFSISFQGNKFENALTLLDPTHRRGPIRSDRQSLPLLRRLFSFTGKTKPWREWLAATPRVSLPRSPIASLRFAPKKSCQQHRGNNRTYCDLEGHVFPSLSEEICNSSGLEADEGLRLECQTLQANRWCQTTDGHGVYKYGNSNSTASL